jgi:Zn-dependent peptidase ImmA (M78 family)
MLSEIAPEEFAQALDGVAAAVLGEAGWDNPPVNCLLIARRLGLEVAYDSRQPGRGRFVSLRSFESEQTRESIFLRPEPRPERVQWAVAHEIGEKFSHQVFAALGVDPREAPRGARETVANHLAGRMLLPSEWFEADAADCGWDLLALKARYATASHELIARRMLDFDPWIVITVFDNDRQTFRRSNRYRRKPELAATEIECRQLAAQRRSPQAVEAHGYRVQAWPIYEADWRREIMRTERDEIWDESA